MKCQFIKKNNQKCNANAMTNSQYCFTHNPEMKNKRKEAVLRGGLSVKKKEKPIEAIKIKNIKDLIILLEDTINRVRTDPMTHQKANCIGYLANITIRAFETKKPIDILENPPRPILNGTSINHNIEINEKS